MDPSARRPSITASHRSHHRTASGDVIASPTNLASPNTFNMDPRGRPSISSGSAMMINVIGVNGAASVKSIHGRSMSFGGDVKVIPLEKGEEGGTTANVETRNTITSPSEVERYLHILFNILNFRDKNASSCGCFAF